MLVLSREVKIRIGMKTVKIPDMGARSEGRGRGTQISEFQAISGDSKGCYMENLCLKTTVAKQTKQNNTRLGMRRCIL